MQRLIGVPLLCLALGAQSASAAGAGHGGSAGASTAPPQPAASSGPRARQAGLGPARSAGATALERSIVDVERARIQGQAAKVLTLRADPPTADDKALLIGRGYFAVAQPGGELWCTHLEGADADGWHRLTCIRFASSSPRAR